MGICSGVVVFSCSLVFLMTSLMLSLVTLRCSALLHHMGRLYSQAMPSFLQALHQGLTSSHFFLRKRQVKQPGESAGSRLDLDRKTIPVLDRRCSFD